MEEKEKPYKISEKLLNSVLGYLAAQPYQEVFGLIQALQSCEYLGEPKKTDEVSK